MIANDLLMILKEESEDDFRSVKRLSSSGKCSKALAFSFLGYPRKDYGVDTLFDFAIGQSMHNYISSLLAKRGKLYNMNKSVVLKAIEEVEGHIDGEDEQGRLVEIKTIKSVGFREAKQGNISKSYYYQVQAYIEAGGYNECVMLYVNKSYFLKSRAQRLSSDQEFVHSCLIRRDDECIKKIYEKWNRLLKGNLLEIQPDITPDEYWQCDYCGYDDICKYYKGKNKEANCVIPNISP